MGENDLARAVEIALFYYDRAYDYGLSKRDPETLHFVEATSVEDAVPKLETLATELWNQS